MDKAGVSDRYLLTAWQRTGGKAWEPPCGTNHPAIQKLVKAGYVRITDGRCMFERMKDVMCVWTEAGKRACEAVVAQQPPLPTPGA